VDIGPHRIALLTQARVDLALVFHNAYRDHARSYPEADVRRVHDEFDAVDWFLVVILAIRREGSTMLAVP